MLYSCKKNWSKGESFLKSSQLKLNSPSPGPRQPPIAGQHWDCTRCSSRKRPSRSRRNDPARRSDRAFRCTRAAHIWRSRRSVERKYRLGIWTKSKNMKKNQQSTRMTNYDSTARSRDHLIWTIRHDQQSNPLFIRCRQRTFGPVKNEHAFTYLPSL